MMSRINCVLIMAAGMGTRFGAGSNKVLTDLDGKSILSYTVDVFQHHPKINDLIIVHHVDDRPVLETMALSYTKLRGLVLGGKERYDSVRQGLAFLKTVYEQKDLTKLNVLIHDGARPFVTSSIIDETLGALESNGAVTVALPVTDTLYQVDDSLHIQDIPPRHHYYRAQTPQSFAYDLIARSYDKGSFLSHPTDDCMVVKEAFPDVPIRIIQGDTENIKVTFESDLLLALQILKKRAADLA